VDGTRNKAGTITHFVELPTLIEGRTMKVAYLVTSLGQETVILGYPWLKKENPNIDWDKKTLNWRKVPFHLKTIVPLKNDELVISFIEGTLTDQAREDWMKTRMSYSQLFALEEEKAKYRPKEEIVPKEFHRFLNTVFTERPLGQLPPRRSCDHKIIMKPGYIPKRGVIYRQGPEHDKAVAEFVKEHLEKGFI
jgi:hypothetical protein